MWTRKTKDKRKKEGQKSKKKKQTKRKTRKTKQNERKKREGEKKVNLPTHPIFVNDFSHVVYLYLHQILKSTIHLRY